MQLRIQDLFAAGGQIPRCSASPEKGRWAVGGGGGGPSGTFLFFKQILATFTLWGIGVPSAYMADLCSEK